MNDSLFERLRELDLPTQDYAIFGSGPLVIRHIVPTCNDLDIICRGEVWEIVKRRGQLKVLPEYDVTVASFFDGAITFGTKWGIGNFVTDELIDSAEMIDSLPFVRLDYVVEYKLVR
jgi:hypothetical protein